MNEIIDTLVKSIESKGNSLKEYTSRHFDLIHLPRVAAAPASTPVPARRQASSPASYLLYGLAGVFVIGAFVTSAKLLCLGLAAGSAYAGYKVGDSANSSAPSSMPRPQSPDIASIKNAAADKVVAIIKYVNSTWDNFMEPTQKRVYSLIENSPLSASQKDALINKVVFHEVIEFKISDFSTRILGVNDVEGLRNLLEKTKHQIIDAIDSACRKQIDAYRSLAI